MNIHELRLSDDSARRDSYAELARVIREKNLDAGVVVGVTFGGQAEAVLEHSDVGELLGIDAYEPPPAADAAAASAPPRALDLSSEQFENLFWYMMGRLSRFGPRYSHVRGSSAQGAQILNVELDFVLLDGERSQRRVLQDLALWYPKLRVGGIIGGHGYGAAASPGVKLAVDQFLAPFSLPVQAEKAGVWWAQKHV